VVGDLDYLVAGGRGWCDGTASSTKLESKPRTHALASWLQ